MGRRERINVPGTVEDGNWSYRMSPSLEELESDASTRERLRALAVETGRLPP
jgi:4-alpha-glucanotransferase